jgi:hypothetical protein
VKIALYDYNCPESTESFDTVSEAQEAVEAWYKKLAIYNLPVWDYPDVQDPNRFVGEVTNYAERVADALGCDGVDRQKFGLRALLTT